MSFDARVSFEREEYTAVNERIPTCPFNCSNHGICVNAGFFRGMCVCFKGYAGFYCQNNATKLIPNDEESVFERKIRPGDWEYFYVESENTTLSASAILSVQIINYKDVNLNSLAKKSPVLLSRTAPLSIMKARKLRSKRPFR